MYIRAIRPGFKCRAPAHLTLVIARAYMLQGSCCPGCFEVCPGMGMSGLQTPSLRSFVCPRPLILFFEIQQMRSLNIFDRYRSHSRHALQFTGPVTIHFRIRELTCSGVLEAITTEGRLVWVLYHSWYDNVLSPVVGGEYCLFQGFCCGFRR